SLAVNVVARTPEVHPHVRGARGLGRGLLGRGVGPSPRAWGSVRRRTACGSGARSIPTCVGLGRRPEDPPEGAAVLPHVRGARLLIVVLDEAHTGPSPRAWGSGAGCGSSTTQGRSIPTCVGLGPVLRRGLCPGTVHPHVRGARARPRSQPGRAHGPSPRAWGSGPSARAQHPAARTTPS